MNDYLNLFIFISYFWIERSNSQPTRSNSSQNPSPRPNQSSEDSRRFWEEKRLMFLLGSTSILFSVCIIPQLVLSLMIHEAVLESYSFQVCYQFSVPSYQSINICVPYILFAPFSLTKVHIKKNLWICLGIPSSSQYSWSHQLFLHFLHLLLLQSRFPSDSVSNLSPLQEID